MKPLPTPNFLACRFSRERDLVHINSYGGNMLTKLHALMAAAFLCLLICVLAVPAWSQDPRQGRGDGQRGGRGQVALPDGPGKEGVQMQCTKCHALGLIANAGGNTK